MLMIKKRVLKIGILLLFVIFISSCKKDNNEKTVLHDNLPPFDEIELKSVFDVYLSQDTFYSVKVTGNKDMINNVIIENDNNVVKIKNTSKLKWLSPEDNKITLYISSDRPKKITAFETCNIQTVNPIITDEFGIILGSKLNQANLELNNNIFYFWNIHPCGGKLILRGKTNNLRLWNFAIMSVDAVNLDAGMGLVENHSKGDCSVYVNNTLDYSIYGEGNIYLFGNPGQIVLHENTSSGRLIRMN